MHLAFETLAQVVTAVAATDGLGSTKELWAVHERLGAQTKRVEGEIGKRGGGEELARRREPREPQPEDADAGAGGSPFSAAATATLTQVCVPEWSGKSSTSSPINDEVQFARWIVHDES